MTEAQSWREIARRIAEGEWDYDGLCEEIGRLRFHGDITSSLARRMVQRCQGHVSQLPMRNGLHVLSAYPLNDPDGIEGRILGALWMALEAENEAT